MYNQYEKITLLLPKGFSRTRDSSKKHLLRIFYDRHRLRNTYMITQYSQRYSLGMKCPLERLGEDLVLRWYTTERGWITKAPTSSMG
jgi:hypothetical protein